jgi:hypothetical protein
MTLPEHCQAPAPGADAVGAVGAADACGAGAGPLNDACLCISLDRDALGDALEAELGDEELVRLVRERCPHAFSDRPVFVGTSQLRRMRELIAAVERVVAMPGWRERALAAAPAIARHDPRGVGGVFFGYDFHASGASLGLIEINTNAGGAMLNAVLARAQRACCDAVRPFVPTLDDVADFERRIVAMFGREWRAARGDRPLQCVAIVDEAPEQQYLYPEFLLFQRLLERHGIAAVVADPGELELREGALHCSGTRVDLVYNRLTDFYLESERNAVLRDAYLQDAIVLTPHPQAHALYADKRRLVALSDSAFLDEIGVDQETRRTLLDSVPRTEIVDATAADRLWAGRNRLFFKPFAGFGSRAAYRGDKLTKRVWNEIVAGGYIAQALVAPGERRTGRDDGQRALKFDLRCFVYGGAVQWIAARVYQGQTTNFRTPGGGFAPVYGVPDEQPGPRPSQPASRTGQADADIATSAGGAAAPRFASYLFLLDDAGGVHPLPHSLYVALASAEGASASLAGSRLRLVDWYVRMADDRPQAVANEWYGWIRFGPDGCVEPTDRARQQPKQDAQVAPLDQTALPTVEERRRMEELLFGVRTFTGGSSSLTAAPGAAPRLD